MRPIQWRHNDRWRRNERARAAFGQQQSVRLLQSIDSAAWSIAVLLVIVAALLLFGLLRSRAKQTEPNWNEVVEKAYEAGEYAKALQTLATCELQFPRSERKRGAICRKGNSKSDAWRRLNDDS